MKSNFSLYDRFINPFSPKIGVDELPDFIPEEHYIQVKNLCEEATRRIIHTTHQTNELSKINELLKAYEYLFDETEIWIKLYSGFDEFSFLYLELCEIKVVLVEYPKIIKKALHGLNQYPINSKIHFSDSHRMNHHIYKIEIGNLFHSN